MTESIAARQTPVYIAGMGAVTAYGWGTQAMEEGMATGESAVTLQTGLEPHISGGEAYLGVIPEQPGSEGVRRTLSKFTRVTRFVADEAVADAKARGWEPGDDVGVIVCTVLGDVQMWRDHYATQGLIIDNRKSPGCKDFQSPAGDWSTSMRMAPDPL